MDDGRDVWDILPAVRFRRDDKPISTSMRNGSANNEGSNRLGQMREHDEEFLQKIVGIQCGVVAIVRHTAIRQTRSDGLGQN